MLVETPQTDSLRAEASMYSLKIACWPYSLAVERLFTLFDLPPNSNWQAVEAPGGHIMLNTTSDVPGWAWAQALGLGWAFKGSGLRKVKPDPKLTAGLGLGLVGLEPGLP